MKARTTKLSKTHVAILLLATLPLFWVTEVAVALLMLLAIGIVFEVADFGSRYPAPNKRANTLTASLGFMGLSAALSAIILRIDEDGLWLFFIAVFIAVATDIAAQIGGTSIRSPKVKFLATISPNKSWAGMICGYCAGFATTVGFWAWRELDERLEAPGWLKWILALVLPLAAITGDLHASWTKRAHQTIAHPTIKDFSRALGPMGGLMDRFDSHSWVMPLYTVALLMFTNVSI